ncbi:MAG: hypothetical protein P4L43_11140 [Syntrophobacteraceae bacterium]|nr:hypothetical protein [Syntrophobacteraceae bacterium]
MMKMRMNKKLVMGMALAMVLVSGAFVNANAQCASCMPRISFESCTNCQAVQRPPLASTCQGAFNYGPTTPVPMGTAGGAAGG